MNAILLDLGGTHLRLASLQNSQIKNEEVFPSPQNQDEFLKILQNYLLKHPKATIFASIAGPIENTKQGQVVQLTNLNFSISKKELEASTHVQVHIINDLHALALSIPSLSPKDVILVIEESHIKSAQKIGIISCGTGLGVSFANGDGVSLPSEAGHLEFAATSDLEWELFQFLKKKFDHVSYERVLSGNSQKAYLEFFQNRKKEDPNLHWWEMLGRFASSVALMNLCDDGIYLAGGYLRSKAGDLPKYKEAFKSSFFAKGRLSHVLKMKVILISHPTPELIGLQRFSEI